MLYARVMRGDSNCLRQLFVFVFYLAYFFVTAFLFLFVMQDCDLLYLSDRPENLLLRNIAVPPLALRPSVFVDSGTQRLSHTSVYLYP